MLLITFKMVQSIGLSQIGSKGSDLDLYLTYVLALLKVRT